MVKRFDWSFLGGHHRLNPQENPIRGLSLACPRLIQGDLSASPSLCASGEATLGQHWALALKVLRTRSEPLLKIPRASFGPWSASWSVVALFIATCASGRKASLAGLLSAKTSAVGLGQSCLGTGVDGGKGSYVETPQELRMKEAKSEHGLVSMRFSPAMPALVQSPSFLFLVAPL